MRNVALSAFMLLGLSACVLDKEATVRAQLGNWVVLGDTRFFQSQRQCTAGLFRTKARNVTSRIKRVRSVNRGLRLIQDGEAVAFKIDGMTPAELHKQLDREDRTAGIAMLVSGLGARGCLSPELKDAFALALQDADVVLMYDPQNRALALFERAKKRVFYARGRV